MKLLLLIFGLSLLISLLISPLRGDYVSIGPISGFKLSSIVGFLIYFITTVVSLYKTRNKASSFLVVFFIIIGQQILTLPIRIINFEGTLVSLLECFILVSSVLLGYWFYESSKISKLLIATLSITYCFYMSIEGYNLWIHKLNFGTFTGKTEIIPSFDVRFINEQNSEVSLKEMKEEFVIMDFWFSGCGICFSEMPKVQKLCNELNANPDVILYAVNAKLKTDADTFAFTRLKELGFSLPTLRIEMGDPALQQLGVRSYPTVLIFDSNRNLIFRGSIDSARKRIFDLIDKE